MARKGQYELKVLAQIEQVKGFIEQLETKAKCIDEAIATEKNTLKTLTDIHESASGTKNKGGE